MQQHPGAPKRDVMQGVHGRAENVADVINQMLADGELENRGSPSGMALYVAGHESTEVSSDE